MCSLARRVLRARAAPGACTSGATALCCGRENMSETHTGRRGSGAVRCENGNAPALGAADWLGLAAAPTFVTMALLTGVGGGPPDVLCSAARAASPLSGMVPMYLLMSAFHSAPWLK